MTINNNTELFKFGNWNEYNLNPLTRIHWRASLVKTVVARKSRVFCVCFAINKHTHTHTLLVEQLIYFLDGHSCRRDNLERGRPSKQVV